ncbi:ANR family transcriptional regulator [Pantoea eucalypti]|uniref:ANR family transcriptional regulator n=1 Tax=Pantoea eucalypti TaxID=470933 RepID=UPI0028A1D9B9|nr:ANR family transcriptional regulator [Pantoea eucalypti]
MNQNKTASKRDCNYFYYAAAETAAFAESCGKYAQAKKLWLRAMKLAKRPINAQWAEHRSQFCMSALRNGWSYFKG